MNQIRLVRLKNPEKGEEGLIFKTLEYNRVTKRYHIQVLNVPNWDPSLMPIEVVGEDEIEFIDQVKKSNH